MVEPFERRAVGSIEIKGKRTDHDYDFEHDQPINDGDRARQPAAHAVCRYRSRRGGGCHTPSLLRVWTILLENNHTGDDQAAQITILYVAGGGDTLTVARCIAIAGCRVIRVPGQWACELGLRLAWRVGISTIPPEITPYMTGQCIMTTDRLRAFLGSEYEVVRGYNVEEAFVESLAGVVPRAAEAQPSPANHNGHTIQGPHNVSGSGNVN